MDNPNFPANSEASKREPLFETDRDHKGIKRVTSKEPVRRRKSLRKQFSQTFVAGDAKSTIQYVLLDVMLPAVKDMIVEAGAQGIEKLIFGESRRRGSISPHSGPTGYVSYNRMSSMASRFSSAGRAMSRQARSSHNFDEIVLESRTEAEEVIDRLFDLVGRYEAASVADLYELVGVPSSHTDHKWGWTNLGGAGVSRVRGGYLLDLPEPHPFD